MIFVAPSKPLHHGWLDQLLARRPTLVVVDGVNEAMVLQGQKIDLEGWSLVRRALIVPFKEIGAAVLECDHLPLSADPLRGDAYGTVHKGNVIDGVRFALVRKERFGRGRRGCAWLYSTKDRNGQVELHGSANDSGAVYLGTLIVDDTDTTPDFLALYAPEPDEEKSSDCTSCLTDVVYEVILALPEQSVKSTVLLSAAVRAAGHQYRDKAIRDAAADLVIAGRLVEVFGKRGAKGYQVAAATSAQPSTPARDETDSGHAHDPGPLTSARRPPTGGPPRWAEVNAVSSSDLGGRGGPRWAEVTDQQPGAPGEPGEPGAHMAGVVGEVSGSAELSGCSGLKETPTEPGVNGEPPGITGCGHTGQGAQREPIPGALAPDSPGQTDRMKQAHAKATANTQPACSLCGEPLWAPASIERGLCERCHLAATPAVAERADAEPAI